MARGHDASDWTVKHDGDQGTVVSAEYAGRFKVKQSGIVQIIWMLGKGPGPKEDGPISRAALEAIDAAIRPQSGS